MKSMLIVFAVWFALAWFPQLIQAWVLEARFKKAKKNASRDEKWLYE